MEHGYFIFAAHFPDTVSIQAVEKEKHRGNERMKFYIYKISYGKSTRSHENRNWALCENVIEIG